MIYGLQKDSSLSNNLLNLGLPMRCCGEFTFEMQPVFPSLSLGRLFSDLNMILSVLLS